ncbi:WEB family protein [Platanthera zijinensis]|uniref:WEB family protein n=1 Tax=Platanthera zijinensis TaxID=2320716 RepID=A0AAP0FZM0_9ASPA
MLNNDYGISNIWEEEVCTELGRGGATGGRVVYWSGCQNCQFHFSFSMFFHNLKHHSVEDFELMNVQEQAAQLEKDLIIKERETLEVLQELEKTKKTVDDLKFRLHELSDANKFSEALANGSPVHFIHGGVKEAGSPGSILVELGQAKVILSRTTSYLTSIQASIESISYKLREEKALHQKNLENVSSKNAIVSSLEEELKQMTLRLTKQANGYCNGDPVSISMEIMKLNSEREQFKQAIEAAKSEVKRLASEREQFKQAIEAAKSEVKRLASEIELINVSIKAGEIRIFAAKKMEEAAKATEAAAVAQAKALSNTSSSIKVILSTDEYTILIRKVQEAEEISRKRIELSVLDVERANRSNVELMEKLAEAATDLETAKKFLEEAMDHADVANRGKLSAEEALRRWRSEHGQKRRYIHNSAKFKSSYPGHQKRVSSRMLDLNGLNLVNDGPWSGLSHTFSIGEILSRKLIGPVDDDYNTGIPQISAEKVKVSLRQLLDRGVEVLSPKNGCRSSRKKNPTKRKRFGFLLLARLLRNERSKRKKTKKNKKRRQYSCTG